MPQPAERDGRRWRRPRRRRDRAARARARRGSRPRTTARRGCLATGRCTGRRCRPCPGAAESLFVSVICAVSTGLAHGHAGRASSPSTPKRRRPTPARPAAPRPRRSPLRGRDGPPCEAAGASKRVTDMSASGPGAGRIERPVACATTSEGQRRTADLTVSVRLSRDRRQGGLGASRSAADRHAQHLAGVDHVRVVEQVPVRAEDRLEVRRCRSACGRSSSACRRP